MTDNRTIHLVDIPIGGNEGVVWNRLHGEREDLCEALLKDFEPVSQAEDCRKSLQARLRKIDDALDRLMSGSYGICSKCGRPIEQEMLQVDAARAVCLDCWNHESRAVRNEDENRYGDPPAVVLQNLSPFDTILLQTQNSDYRILLLDPKSGRALVEGGTYLAEPRESLVMGCGMPGREFYGGAICVGHRLEMWAGEKVLFTSPIKSVEVATEAGNLNTRSDFSVPPHVEFPAAGGQCYSPPFRKSP